MSRMVAWVGRYQQREIQRLHEEGYRLKEELLKLTGEERIVLSPEERQLLWEKARRINPVLPKQISQFDLEDLRSPSTNDTSTESPSYRMSQPAMLSRLDGHPSSLTIRARELSARLVKIFLPDHQNRRPYQGVTTRAAPGCDDLLLFHEYFHGETGTGLGASHQTGWTSLVADCLWKTTRSKAIR